MNLPEWLPPLPASSVEVHGWDYYSADQVREAQLAAVAAARKESK
jgi:hypothetical protein